MIRVGGRITNSNYDFQKRHPVILPSKHHLTNLIAKSEHINQLHCGPQALLASLRQKYWPLGGKNLVRSLVRNCLTCFRVSPSQERYIMGNLPSDRCTPSRPFLISGVDYAGPFSLKDRLTRNPKIIKAYIALFVCFSTKAIHLELVSDLTSNCYIAALRRFMSRRGKCVRIYSDNSTTFVGAAKEIKFLIKQNEDSITTELSKDNIEFSFIPARAPHFGGLWEAGVKTVKYHLKRVIGNVPLTFEDFYTVLCQIEACINSRPLYSLSTDPNDYSPLTPAHFLIGEPFNSALPSPSLLDVKENLLSKYQRFQKMVQHFWSRWSKEHVSNLQVRTKWQQHCNEIIKPGLLVLVKEDGIPPLKWCIGRVIHTHPGSDGVIRAATIKNNSGTFKRPVVKLCVLPNQK